MDIRTRLSPVNLAALGLIVCALVAAVSVIAVRAHGSGLSTSGPLGDGGDETEVCAPATPGHAVTTASFRLRNLASRPVILDSFATVNATGLQILGASVVRIGQFGSIGLDDGYPPSTLPREFQWDQRRPVVGMSIPPQTAATPPHLVLAVGLARDSTAAGTVSGYKVKYHVDGGGTYLLLTHNAVRLAGSCGS